MLSCALRHQSCGRAEYVVGASLPGWRYDGHRLLPAVIGSADDQLPPEALLIVDLVVDAVMLSASITALGAGGEYRQSETDPWRRQGLQDDGGTRRLSGRAHKFCWSCQAASR